MCRQPAVHQQPKQQWVGPEVGRRACGWPLQGQSSVESEAQADASQKMQLDWPEGCGLTTVTDKSLTRLLCPGPSANRTPNPEGRIRAGDSAGNYTLVGVGVGWEEEVGKSMISYFSIGVRKTFVVSHINLLAELNCMLWNRKGQLLS